LPGYEKNRKVTPSSGVWVRKREKGWDYWGLGNGWGGTKGRLTGGKTGTRLLKGPGGPAQQGGKKKGGEGALKPQKGGKNVEYFLKEF